MKFILLVIYRISINMCRFYKFLLFVAILLASLLPIRNSNAQVSSKYLAFSEIAMLLEDKFSTTIFYNSQWFEGNEFNTRLIDLSLEEALESIIKRFKLQYLQIDGYIVIIPSEISNNFEKTREGDLIVIGNPLEYGRHSKAQVEGYVFDGVSGETLIGAIVYDEVTATGVATNDKGFYSLTLPVGEHKIRLSYMGYEDAYEFIRVIAPGELNFDLFEKSVHLEGATVTAFRKDANIRSTQMSTVRIDPMMMKELPGTMGERDIIKSFSLLPGIQSMGEFGTGFNVRGGDSDQNLIMVEDMPLFNSSHLFGLVSIVNPDMITGVTLIKAGIPARYGERASSVVDIRKRGGNPERTKLTGGIGLLYSRLHLETPLFNRKVFLSLGGRSSYSNWLLHRVPDVDLMNSSANFYDISGVLTINLNSNNSLSIFAYQSNDDFFLAGETKHFYQSRLASLRLNSIITPVLTSRLTFGLSQYNNEVKLPEEIQPQSAFSMASSIDYYTLKWHYDYQPGGNNIYDFGIQTIHYGINPGDIHPIGQDSYVNSFFLDNERGMETAAYVSGNFEITSALSAEVGLRGVYYSLLGPAKSYEYEATLPRLPQNIIDTISYESKWQSVWNDFGLEPRAGLRFLLNDNSSIKLSYNRNNQFINLLSNSSVMAPTDVWRLSNKFTGAMVGNQLALGYFYLFPEQNIELSLESYLKFLKNIVEYRDGSNILMNPVVETDLVNAKGYSYGAELYLTKKSGALTGWLSYTWSRSFRRSNEIHQMFKINDNAYFPSSFDRPHNLILNATYRFTRRWRINSTFTYNTGRPVSYPEYIFEYQGHKAIYYSDRNKYRLPDYHRLDLSISYDENLKLNAKGKGSWSLSLINAYGRKNAYSVFYKKELPTTESSYRKYGLYKLYIIGRPLPSLTYNFTF